MLPQRVVSIYTNASAKVCMPLGSQTWALNGMLGGIWIGVFPMR